MGAQGHLVRVSVASLRGVFKQFDCEAQTPCRKQLGYGPHDVPDGQVFIVPDG